MRMRLILRILKLIKVISSESGTEYVNGTFKNCLFTDKSGKITNGLSHISLNKIAIFTEKVIKCYCIKSAKQVLDGCMPKLQRRLQRCNVKGPIT